MHVFVFMHDTSQLGLDIVRKRVCATAALLLLLLLFGKQVNTIRTMGIYGSAQRFSYVYFDTLCISVVCKTRDGKHDNGHTIERRAN